MKWRAYLEYKDSGIEWLGEIPSHWLPRRLRIVCELNPPKSEIAHLPLDTEISFLPMESIGEDGTFVLDKTRRIEHVWQGYTYFRDGDVAVAKITPCFENGKGALFQGLKNSIGFGTTELHVLRAKEDIDSSFVFYLTRSHAFRLMGTAMMYGAAGQKRVPGDFVKDFSTGFPPLAEQRAIAAFLDRETERIDGLIAKKERQIELLQEKRAALISHAVTKGLAGLPGATHFRSALHLEFKDSGIEWLGEIPAHWAVERSKVVFFEVKGRSETGDEELLTVSHITGVTPRSAKHVYMFMAETLEGYKRCRAGDLVINTMWAWMGALGIAFQDGVVSPSYNVYRFRHPGFDPRYYDRLFRTDECVAEINRFSQGVWKSRLRLYPEEFFQIRIPCPPKDEQLAIADFLDRGTERIDSLVTKVQDSIETLREYRTALISAAVTGKIDVRDEQQVQRTAGATHFQSALHLGYT